MKKSLDLITGGKPDNQRESCQNEHKSGEPYGIHNCTSLFFTLKKRSTALRGHPQGVPLRTLLIFGGSLEDLKFAVFDNQYNRVVNCVPD